MTALTDVPIASLPVERFESVLDADSYRAFAQAADRARGLFEGRRIWNVNSTARGGGVAEMLASLLAYSRGVGVDARWVVIPGNDDFFVVTKRIHNHLHGTAGDGGELGPAEREIYESTLAESARQLAAIVKPEDVVILHDPQTAGLNQALKDEGVPVIWRCHVGLDLANDIARGAWNFLIPYVQPADAYVFSRQAFAWEGLDEERVSLIAPSIDAFSPKNQELSPAAVAAILAAAGVTADGAGEPSFEREDGSPAKVARSAEIFQDAPLASSDRYVLQVSRWDRLKDPLGVIQGFVEHVAPVSDAHLVYAGPAVEAVADDPEGAEVLREARYMWEELPAEARARVHLACLPMDDLEENAAMVNALQRGADIVVQKSIAEGFGLTVSEANWKARPVVATRIGGIQDQIEHGVSGLLIDDPRDLAAYGAAVDRLLGDEETAAAMGREAMRRVREQYLGTRSLMQYLDLMQGLLKPA